MTKLTIFYDSLCPLCVGEMRNLRARNAGQLAFEDLHAPDFTNRFPHIDRARANEILHGQTDTGEMLLGLDVSARAWSLTGNRALTILRWPLIKPLADFFYRVFAKHRYRISYWLTGQARCQRCDISQPKDSCRTR